MNDSKAKKGTIALALSPIALALLAGPASAAGAPAVDMTSFTTVSQASVDAQFQAFQASKHEQGTESDSRTLADNHCGSGYTVDSNGGTHCHRNYNTSGSSPTGFTSIQDFDLA